MNDSLPEFQDPQYVCPRCQGDDIAYVYDEMIENSSEFQRELEQGYCNYCNFQWLEPVEHVHD